MNDFRKPDADWKNNGSECPAFGIFAITSNVVSGGKSILQGSQPSTTFSRNYAVNDGYTISANGYGGAYTHGIVRVAYDTGTPAAGETWGPKPSQWTASKGYPGFVCLGVVDSTAKTMLARVEQPELYIGKANADIEKDDTGDVSMWIGDAGSESDSTVDITGCYNRSGATVKSGDWVRVYFIDGEPYVESIDTKPGTISRAIVTATSISEEATGNVKRWDSEAVDWSATTTSLFNTARPIFKDEEIVVGKDDSSRWVTLGVVSHTLEGTSNAAISKGASGTVTLGELTDDPTITAWSYLGEIASGDIVYVIWFNGKWRIIAAECPEEA